VAVVCRLIAAIVDWVTFIGLIIETRRKSCRLRANDQEFLRANADVLAADRASCPAFVQEAMSFMSSHNVSEARLFHLRHARSSGIQTRQPGFALTATMAVRIQRA
jgi:hypothetical protein